MKLFHSIFGGGETRGRYPETLLREANERAVDGTDTRLRLVPGYRRHLREPVIHAIDHVVALVDAIPSPLVADRRGYSAEPRLAAVFASAAAMLDMFGRDTALATFLATPDIQRDEGDPSARRVVLQELHNASGQRAVMLPISLAPRELPPREDFVTAAERYL